MDEQRLHQGVDGYASLDRQGQDAYQFRGSVPDDGAAEHYPGGRIGRELHKPTSIPLKDGAGIGGEGDFGGADFAANSRGVGFLKTDRGDLGFGEHGLGDLAVIDWRYRQTERMASDLATLHGGDRREQHLARAVTGTVNSGDRGSRELVNLDIVLYQDVLDSG